MWVCGLNELCMVHSGATGKIKHTTHHKFKGIKARIILKYSLMVGRLSLYLQEHITSAVEVLCHLVTLMLFGQDGLHLHHPRSYKNVVRLDVPEANDRYIWDYCCSPAFYYKLFLMILTLLKSGPFAAGRRLSVFWSPAGFSCPSVWQQPEL